MMHTNKGRILTYAAVCFVHGMCTCACDYEVGRVSTVLYACRGLVA